MPPAANVQWNPARPLKECRDPGTLKMRWVEPLTIILQMRSGRLRRPLSWRPLAYRYCSQPLPLFFDNVAAQTLILFRKQLSCACKACRRGIRRNTDDDRYFLIRDPPGSTEEQREGIPFGQVR